MSFKSIVGNLRRALREWRDSFERFRPSDDMIYPGILWTPGLAYLAADYRERAAVARARIEANARRAAGSAP